LRRSCAITSDGTTYLGTETEAISVASNIGCMASKVVETAQTWL